jgi:hypothetical protein
LGKFQQIQFFQQNDRQEIGKLAFRYFIDYLVCQSNNLVEDAALDRLNMGIVGLISAQGMDVVLVFLCSAACVGTGLASG